MSEAKQNTDKLLWEEVPNDFYSPSTLHATADGGITICVDGNCITRTPREWHASRIPAPRPQAAPEFTEERAITAFNRIVSYAGGNWNKKPRSERPYPEFVAVRVVRLEAVADRLDALVAACEAMLAAFEYDGGRLVGAVFDARNQLRAALAAAKGEA